LSHAVLGIHPAHDPGSAPKVAFVCTANRARSPFAAALLRERLGTLPIEVESFGVLEQGGAPALPAAVRAAWPFGIDLTPHRAHVLRPDVLETFELVIGFEPMHVASSIEVGGAMPSSSFLLGELADVLEFDVLPWPPGSDDLASRVAHANARRFAGSRIPRAVADPAGGSERRFRETYEEIEEMVGLIGVRLFDVTRGRAG
jgi:protein-tyrosine-phosphatase